MLERINHEAIRLGRPAFADELVGREALERLQSTSEVVGRDEVGEVAPKLIVVVVVEALDGRVRDGAIHSLDLAVGPRVLRRGGSMIDPGLRATQLEGMRPEEFPFCQRVPISGTADPPAPGVVNWMPLSVRTVWTL